jgi:hypothetical protein
MAIPGLDGFLNIIWSWDILIGLIELYALWLIRNRNRYGFLLGVTAGISWILYALVNQHTYGLIIICLPAAYLNLTGFRLWGKGGRCQWQ